MIKIGNYFFHNRNWVFPIFYLVLFIPSVKLSENYLLVLTVGLIIALTGQAVRMITIGLIYIRRGGKNRQIYADGLVVEGIFSHCRNPMYVGNILILLGMAIISNSLLSLFVFFPFFVFVYQSIVLAEENFLRGKFGSAFDKYTGNVNRWMINFNGLSETLIGTKFRWKRVLRQEYGTTFLWTMAATALAMQQVYLLNGSASLKSSGSQFAAVIGFLILCYGTVRFLKKTDRLSDDV